MIYFFPKGSISTPSSRFRAFYVAERLQKSGLDVAICRSPRHYSSVFNITFERIRDFFSNLIFVARFSRSDIIFLQKTIFQPEIIYLIFLFRRFRGYKVIFDIDDLSINGIAKFLFRKADLVIVSSHYLQKIALWYNSFVELVPTGIPLEDYEKCRKKKYSASLPAIGWMGSVNTHRKNLKLLAQVFKKLLDDGNNFSFTLISYAPDNEVDKMFVMPGLKFRRLGPFSGDQIPIEAGKFDISVMPLEDTSRNRAKASFKLIESMAVGVPVVGSNIGENNYLIKNEENGFLAAGIDEWAEKLSLLLKDEALRKKIGEGGFETVRKFYSLETLIPKYISILKRLSRAD